MLSLRQTYLLMVLGNTQEIDVVRPGIGPTSTMTQSNSALVTDKIINHGISPIMVGTTELSHGSVERTWPLGSASRIIIAETIKTASLVQDQ